MSEVTSPILTDATGQEIVSKLNTLLTKMDNLAAAFQPNASGIVYNNTTSGLTGDDVQEAIDEMAGDVSEINSALSQFLPCYTPSMTVVQTSITSQSSAQDYTFNDDGIYSFAVTGTTSGQEMVISLSTLDGAILIFHRAYNQNSDIIHTTLFGLKKGTYKLQLKGTNCYIKKYTP